jgi:hypothetical protein
MLKPKLRKRRHRGSSPPIKCPSQICERTVPGPARARPRRMGAERPRQDRPRNEVPSTRRRSRGPQSKNVFHLCIAPGADSAQLSRMQPLSSGPNSQSANPSVAYDPTGWTRICGACPTNPVLLRGQHTAHAPTRPDACPARRTDAGYLVDGEPLGGSRQGRELETDVSSRNRPAAEFRNEKPGELKFAGPFVTLP